MRLQNILMSNLFHRNKLHVIKVDAFYSDPYYTRAIQNILFHGMYCYTKYKVGIDENVYSSCI